LQVGHHDAWIATRIGFPAFWAAAKDFASNVLVSKAKAWAVKPALAAIAARTTERRESMMGVLLVLMAKSFLGPAGVACTSQSAGWKSNSGHSAASGEGQTAGRRAGEPLVPGVGRDRCRSGRLVDQPRK
jgi:hypothetical protein